MYSVYLGFKGVPTELLQGPSIILCKYIGYLLGELDDPEGDMFCRKPEGCQCQTPNAAL